MQDIARDQANTENTLKSSPILIFLASLPFRRIGPLVTSFTVILLSIPFLCLVVLAPSLFVTDPTMEVLTVWLDARAIVDEPPSLTIAANALADGSFLYLMLVNAGSALGATPGQALLIAQGLMAMLLVVPLSYGAAMRLPFLPALMLTLFVVLTLLSPAGGVLSAQTAGAVAVFLWLSLITYARPHRAILTCAQTEGFAAGLGLWVLYMTATPLFLAALVGFAVAMVLQGRRGLIFTMMAVAIFLIIGACAELLSQMTVGHGLVTARLSSLVDSHTVARIGLPHMLLLVLVPLGLMIHQRPSLIQFFALVLLVTTGSAGLVVFGADVLPLLLLAGLLAIFARAGKKDRILIKNASAQALAGIMALCLIPLAVIVADTSRAGGALAKQYARAPFAQTADLGFSFADQPRYADLILSRKVDYTVARDFALTPADQAVLMKEGLALAERFAAEQKLVGLVSAGNLSPLSAVEMQDLKDAQIVVTPTLAIDRLTDEARITSQGILYADYKKADRREQVSPVYDIWIRRSK